MRRHIVAGVGSLVVLSLPLTASATTSSAHRPASHVVNAPTASNQTVRLRVGDRLVVRLGSSFDPPHSSNPAVVHRISSAGGYPTGEPVRAIFRAVTAGRATVSSTTDYPCLHATPPCEIAEQIWTVRVVVLRRSTTY